MSAPKILIENPNGLGSPVEQVTLDTNRVNVLNETTSRLANMVAISSRGTWVDVTQWITYPAAVFSVGKLALLAGAAPWAVALLLGVPLVVLTSLLGSVVEQRPKLKTHAATRFASLAIGTLLAIL
jgi:hypothetical protein